MLKTKQIDWVAGANIRISNLSANGGSTNVTTAISTALSTAGRNGVSVPVQVSADENSVGVVTAAAFNFVPIESYTTKDKFKDASNNEVYGRLTESAGVYTLTYYTLVNGVETAYSFSSATPINLDFSYRFDFPRLPGDFAIALQTRILNADPRGSAASATMFSEQLTVTALNTLSNLTKTPNVTGNVFLFINEAVYSSYGGASAFFSVSGKAITWSATNAKFSIDTTDKVIAFYSTLE